MQLSAYEQTPTLVRPSQHKFCSKLVRSLFVSGARTAVGVPHAFGQMTSSLDFICWDSIGQTQTSGAI